MIETTYVARPFGMEVLEDSAWVAAFPDGPLMCLNAVSFEILMSVHDAGPNPVSVSDVLAVLCERISDIPEDAQPIVQHTLEEFAAAGLLITATRGQQEVEAHDG